MPSENFVFLPPSFKPYCPRFLSLVSFSKSAIFIIYLFFSIWLSNLSLLLSFILKLLSSFISISISQSRLYFFLSLCHQNSPQSISSILSSTDVILGHYEAGWLHHPITAPPIPHPINEGWTLLPNIFKLEWGFSFGNLP